MLFSLAYFALHSLLCALARSDRSDLEREAELLVLRHQLKVLSRGRRRPAFRRRDRMLLAAASRILPMERWRAFVVSPQTLLRWHRELIRRKWTYRRRSPGRPPLDPETVELIVRMAREKLQMGLPADPRRAAETRHPCLRHVDPDGPAPRRSRPGSPPDRCIVERVPPGPSSRNRGHRLLCCGDGLASDDVRALRYRARVQTGAPPRRDQEPRFGVGDPAGSEPGGGGAASRRWLPDPRPGFEVLRSIRRGLPD